uniref:Uncharacterized protein n=1 Tax=Cucumis melo TaxID=3656 RepID=A0A9I9EFG6_CUCME
MTYIVYGARDFEKKLDDISRTRRKKKRTNRRTKTWTRLLVPCKRQNKLWTKYNHHRSQAKKGIPKTQDVFSSYKIRPNLKHGRIDHEYTYEYEAPLRTMQYMYGSMRSNQGPAVDSQVPHERIESNLSLSRRFGDTILEGHPYQYKDTISRSLGSPNAALRLQKDQDHDKSSSRR